jgi:hypothetical protein
MMDDIPKAAVAKRRVNAVLTINCLVGVEYLNVEIVSILVACTKRGGDGWSVELS